MLTKEEVHEYKARGYFGGQAQKSGGYVTSIRYWKPRKMEIEPEEEEKE